MDTEALLRLLVADKITGLKPDTAVRLALAGGTIIAGITFFVCIGFRADIADAAQTAQFLAKFAVTMPAVIAAIIALPRFAQPSASVKRASLALGISPLILLLGVLVELATVPSSLWTSKIIGNNASNCLILIPMLSAGPLICFLAAMRTGAPTRPGAAGALGGLAASGIAATFYATNCTDDSALFVVTWYPLATTVVTTAGYTAGRKLLRW
jgi:hypothetical protein